MKWVKRKQNVEVLLDSNGEEIVAGVLWSCALKSKGSQHFFAASNLDYTANSINVQKLAQVWMGEADKWLSDLRKSSKPPNTVVINDKQIDRMVAHIGFIFLPTGNRKSLSKKRVPGWNVWREKLPYYYFGVMRPMFADYGYLAVLHNLDFNHMRLIFVAMELKKKFKHVHQYSVLLSSPLYHADMNIKV